MNEQRESLISNKNLNLERGNEKLLRCSKNLVHCPSFGFNNNSSEDVALDYLAKILVEAFLDKKEYEHNQSSK